MEPGNFPIFKVRRKFTTMNNPDTTTYTNPSHMSPFPNLSNVAPAGPQGASMVKPDTVRCKFYFVYLDERNHPIPGTMFAKNNNKIVGGCAEKIARLTGQTMVAPAGYVQCFPSNGLRYWYQVKSIPTGGGNVRTEIVPNSMIAVRGVPGKQLNEAGGMMSAGRSCSYIEYKIFKPQ